MLRELRQQGYTGGYTILKDYLEPKRQSARVVAVRRFETPPGQQAQADWGHLGTLGRLAHLVRPKKILHAAYESPHRMCGGKLVWTCGSPIPGSHRNANAA